MASEVANNAQEVVNATAAAAAEETKAAAAEVVTKAADEAPKAAAEVSAVAPKAAAEDGVAPAVAAAEGDVKPADGGAAGEPAVVAAVAPAKKEAVSKPLVHKADFEKDTIYLYQFTRTPLLPSLSPYCLKVETWLRLAGLKYEVSTQHYTAKSISVFHTHTAHHGQRHQHHYGAFLVAVGDVVSFSFFFNFIFYDRASRLELWHDVVDCFMRTAPVRGRV